MFIKICCMLYKDAFYTLGFRFCVLYYNTDYFLPLNLFKFNFSWMLYDFCIIARCC